MAFAGRADRIAQLASAGCFDLSVYRFIIEVLACIALVSERVDPREIFPRLLFRSRDSDRLANLGLGRRRGRVDDLLRSCADLLRRRRCRYRPCDSGRSGSGRFENIPQFRTNLLRSPANTAV